MMVTFAFGYTRLPKEGVSYSDDDDDSEDDDGTGDGFAASGSPQRPAVNPGRAAAAADPADDANFMRGLKDGGEYSLMDTWGVLYRRTVGTQEMSCLLYRG